MPSTALMVSVSVEADATYASAGSATMVRSAIQIAQAPARAVLLMIVPFPVMLVMCHLVSLRQRPNQ